MLFFLIVNPKNHIARRLMSKDHKEKPFVYDKGPMHPTDAIETMPLEKEVVDDEEIVTKKDDSSATTSASQPTPLPFCCSTSCDTPEDKTSNRPLIAGQTESLINGIRNPALESNGSLFPDDPEVPSTPAFSVRSCPYKHRHGKEFCQYTHGESHGQDDFTKGFRLGEEDIDELFEKDPDFAVQQLWLLLGFCHGCLRKLRARLDSI
uniref:Uncharacterized protein n=1 Tax=Lobelia spicata TaxID=1441989 RepID=A0A291F0F3_9ASTR|nr:hypothetical protein Lo_spi1Pt0591 [Lobelia spicata]ATG25599.1 hypothetical protein Lo_spi1Pt0591 [Lobelia spicata]